MGWRIIGEGRGGFDGHEEEMEREFERAYRKGREDERRESYGERGGYGRGGYGERDEYDRDGYDDEDGYGERRGVKGTGRYSRYRRR